MHESKKKKKFLSNGQENVNPDWMKVEIVRKILGFTEFSTIKNKFELKKRIYIQFRYFSKIKTRTINIIIYIVRVLILEKYQNWIYILFLIQICF